jgi:hypothetical protein
MPDKLDVTGNLRAPDAMDIPDTRTSEEFPPTTPDVGLPRSPHRSLWPEVPDYEILGELGRGGMGVVYKARQKSLDRLVALKMIRAGDQATAMDLARFRTEALAVARIDHLNVIQIHHSGEVHGRPFFALELAEGGSLAAHLTRGMLPPEQAAVLVETLARAMEHAHQLGILHRDLKPANVLLVPASGEGGLSLGSPQPPAEPGAKWVPKITDFGLAKLLEGQQSAAAGAQATPSQAVLGTPSYMAPEQALGNHGLVGPTSDVYSLGAILYECLTGQPPFRGQNYAETIMQVLEQQPPAPSSLNPAVPSPLARICLKCLEKDPPHRYASARDLADDLRRYREGKHVLGRGRGHAGRLWDAVRRHPLQAAGALLAVLLLAGLLGKELYDQALRERDKKARIEELLDLVHDREAEAQQAARACKIEDMKDAYVRAETLYERLLEFTGESRQPEWRADRARLSVRHGTELIRLRERDAAVNVLEQARAGLEDLTAQQPDRPDWQLILAEAYHKLGEVYSQRNEWQKSLGSYRKGLEIRIQLVKKDETNRTYRTDLARSHGYLGDVQLVLGLKEAEDSYARAEAIRKQLVEDRGTDVAARFQLARSYWNTGRRLSWIGEEHEAIKAYEDHIAYLETFAASSEIDREFETDLAEAFNDLAELYIDVKPNSFRPDALLRRARGEYERLRQARPEDRTLLVDLLRTHLNFVRYQRKRSPAEANRELEQVDALAQLVGQESDDPHKRLERLQDYYYRKAATAALRSQLVPAKNPELRAEYLRQAREHLTSAERNGYRNAARLKRDVAFEPLHRQPEFEALVRKVEKGATGE